MKLAYRVVTVAIALALTGAPALAQDKKPVVGLVMKSLTNECFKSMEVGARKFAEADGTFTLVPVGMSSESDIAGQIATVETFVAQKVDMICVAPADWVRLVAPVRKAMKAGITVVSFDIKLDDKALVNAGLADLVFVGPTTGRGPTWRVRNWPPSSARGPRSSSSRVTRAPTTRRCPAGPPGRRATVELSSPSRAAEAPRPGGRESLQRASASTGSRAAWG